MPDPQKPAPHTSFDEEAFRQMLREERDRPPTPEEIALIKKHHDRDAWSLRYSLIALELGEEAALKASHADADTEDEPSEPTKS